jgi:N-acetylglucosaminyl-diphospho-decaprenol L-rhamnosyltransferase
VTRDFRDADDFTDRSVAVITVTYNSRNEIDEFVTSVARQRMKVTLWLVDNASTDDTPRVLKDLQRSHRWINVILNLENAGLAAANNQPIPQLRENYVVIVNPDVVLNDHALEMLVSSLE